MFSLSSRTICSLGDKISQLIEVLVVPQLLQLLDPLGEGAHEVVLEVLLHVWQEFSKIFEGRTVALTIEDFKTLQSFPRRFHGLKKAVLQ
jgi:hypothetical protein